MDRELRQLKGITFDIAEYTTYEDEGETYTTVRLYFLGPDGKRSTGIGYKLRFRGTIDQLQTEPGGLVKEAVLLPDDTSSL